jgi:hypothetical protein
MRDATKRVIETFQELMGALHEDVPETKDASDVAQLNPDVAQVNPNKDIGAMIAEIRPTLVNASEAAGELNPSRAMCLSWLLDNVHLLDRNKMYVLKEAMSVLLDSENS